MNRLVSAVFACTLVTGVAYAQHDHTTMSPPPATVATPAVSEHDRTFADAMSSHHEDGIKMADLASRKATTPELRDMAAKMITDQRHEISELQRLRGDGAMTSPEAMMEMPGLMTEAEMTADLGRLEAATGKEFDRIFTEVMPKHHAGAIRMSEHYLAMGSNEGMKGVARQIIDKQTRESQQLAAMHEATPEVMTSSVQEETTAPRARMRKD